MPIDIIGFLIFAAAMIGTPGPANMVVMASGARFGVRASLPFLGGVILGKQLIIWPLGLGLLTLIGTQSIAFQVLRALSVAYILWLAWKIAGARIAGRDAQAKPPTFTQGLIVHPLNPKAWAMILGTLTNFIAADATPFTATLALSLGLLGVQCVLQPLWMLFGVQIARLIGGTDKEIWLMRGLAAAMLASVVYALI